MNPPDPGFNVSMSGATRERLDRLHARAAADGRRAEFLASLQTILERLRDEPVSFGEELYDLHALRLTIKLGVVLPVVVEFGVYPDRRLVIVREFRYVPPG